MTRPSIQIADLRMSDEGKYICEYATYPSGNEQGTTQLIMLGMSTSDLFNRLLRTATSELDLFFFKLQKIFAF